jgi:hypothetical protein
MVSFHDQNIIRLEIIVTGSVSESKNTKSNFDGLDLAQEPSGRSIRLIHRETCSSFSHIQNPAGIVLLDPSPNFHHREKKENGLGCL